MRQVLLVAALVVASALPAAAQSAPTPKQALASCELHAPKTGAFRRDDPSNPLTGGGYEDMGANAQEIRAHYYHLCMEAQGFTWGELADGRHVALTPDGSGHYDGDVDDDN